MYIVTSRAPSQMSRYGHWRVVVASMQRVRIAGPCADTPSLRTETMNVKCNECGLVRTKKEAYTGKYALLNDDSIIMLSNRGKLRLSCPVCGDNTHHEVI